MKKFQLLLDFWSIDLQIIKIQIFEHQSILMFSLLLRDRENWCTSLNKLLDHFVEPVNWWDLNLYYNWIIQSLNLSVTLCIQVHFVSSDLICVFSFVDIYFDWEACSVEGRLKSFKIAESLKNPWLGIDSSSRGGGERGAGLGDFRLLGRVSTPLYAILIHCIFFVLVLEISNFMKGNFLFLNLDNWVIWFKLSNRLFLLHFKE